MITRTQLIDLYLDHARAYYRRADGTPTRHADNLELALRPLRSGDSADSFSLSDLRAYRDALISRGLLRRTINQWTGWVRGLFRWAAREQLLAASIAAELAVLDPLRFGRSPAKERSPSRLVTREQLLDLLPFLTPTLARLVRVQWLCGMRSGEVVSMRGDELTLFEGYLVYTPTQHKTRHHDRRRSIVLVRQAAALVDPSRNGFQFLNTRGRPFTSDTYSQAIRRACIRHGLPQFSPGQLRRSAATYARRLVGKEGVQRLLGHASGDTTEIYLSLDVVDSIQTGRLLDESRWSLD